MSLAINDNPRKFLTNNHLSPAPVAPNVIRISDRMSDSEGDDEQERDDKVMQLKDIKSNRSRSTNNPVFIKRKTIH
jgi:hypothetical protein